MILNEKFLGELNILENLENSSCFLLFNTSLVFESAISYSIDYIVKDQLNTNLEGSFYN